MTKKNKLEATRYRKVECRMWGDEKFRLLSPIPPCGQGLWLYLLTGPRTNQIPGIYQAGKAALAEELGWGGEAFLEAFQEVLNQGMVKADWNAKVLFIPKAIFYNKPASGNVIFTWTNQWDLIPECDLKREAYVVLRAAMVEAGPDFMKKFDMAIRKPSPQGFLEGLGGRLGGKDRGKPGTGTGTGSGPGSKHNAHSNLLGSNDPIKSNRFDAFYSRYPRKVGKLKATRAWKTHHCEKHFDEIMSDLDEREKHPGWEKLNKSVPHPTTYINSHRWEDEDKTVGIVSNQKKLTFDEQLAIETQKLKRQESENEN